MKRGKKMLNEKLNRHMAGLHAFPHEIFVYIYIYILMDHMKSNGIFTKLKCLLALKTLLF